ncbi:fumarylacetoacetate hydrolase family protein [Paraburkholderia sediminicola]|uniref:fumarylacetoacetate hydrolase family protein n=1 Tax=Paraburkholderia sediminicola TaxID=458836 RepID=UPI0038BB3552
MKLLSYKLDNLSSQRIGALIHTPLAASDSSEFVVDLASAYAAYLRATVGDPFADQLAIIRIPADVTQFIEGGTLSREAAEHALRYVQTAAAAEIARLRVRGILVPLADINLLAPISRPPKIIAVGANYSGHVKEARDAGVLHDLPDHPVGFLKMPSSVTGPESTILRSRYTDELDYEVELAMVIGKPCRNIARTDWLDYVAGFTIVNDISMRDLILAEKPTGVVFQGKNLDTTCPLGPYIVTADEIGNPDALDISLRVNGVTRQADNTRNMIFSCSDILTFWSSRMTLEPGDIVTTGTAAGVAGFGKRFPERLLKDGDIVEAEIQHIGILRNRIADDRPRLA